MRDRHSLRERSTLRERGAGRQRLARAGPQWPARPAGRLLLSLAVSCAVAGAACAEAFIGSGPSRGATGLGWGTLELGMSLRDAEGRSREALRLHEIEDPCGEAGARLTDDGEELFLAFSTDSPDATLQSIVRRLPPEATTEEVVRDLERRFPELRYRPDPRWPNMPPEEDPRPLYVHPDLPDQGIRVDAEDDWMWVGYLRCIEGESG